MAMLILLVLLIFFAALGIPLAFAIGASCVTYILIYAPTFITMLPQRVWNGAYSELMIAMPLFMLAGELMNTGGITQRIINFCMELLRPIRGGLGEVNIVASMIFGGISGSSVADTSALGSILIPAMEKEGYPPEASAGITVASSTMGMIIPPSTPMIVYSMISGASVGAFFMSLNMPAWAIALIFDVLILMIGTFIDVSPAILLLTPILLPVMVQYGFSPLQFGAMMITGLAIGLVTPPVGMCLNACNKINRMPIIEIFKGAAPYVICNVIVLISISLWGPLTTALPQLLGYSIF